MSTIEVKNLNEWDISTEKAIEIAKCVAQGLKWAGHDYLYDRERFKDLELEHLAFLEIRKALYAYENKISCLRLTHAILDGDYVIGETQIVIGKVLLIITAKVKPNSFELPLLRIQIAKLEKELEIK